MFSAVVLTTSSVRTLNLFKLKKEHYELNYITVMSLKAELSNKILSPNGGFFNGTLNGYNYKLKYRLQESKQTYAYNDTIESSGNYGPYMIYLYKCTLELNKEGFSKEYNFYTIRYKKVKLDA